MDRHASTTPAAHTHAHLRVRCSRMDNTLHPDARQLVESARRARAEAEDLEARARAKRDELGAYMGALVRRHGVPKRAVARLLNYRSDNSVRVKTFRNG